MRRVLSACLVSLSSFVVVSAVASVSQAAPPGQEKVAPPTTTVTWHGHAAFSITTPSGRVLWIDPWLKNPLNPEKDPIGAAKKGDYILLTHGHFDHVGDSVELAKKTGARLVASFELGTNLVRTHGYPAQQLGYDGLGNPGGVLTLGDGEITVAFTPAVHSSGLDAPDGEAKGTAIGYGGNPVGYVIRVQGGPTIYHSGDTAYFGDMALIGEAWRPDVALLNVGGHFGMEPDAAVKAAKAVRAKLVVPQHYKTFPVLTQDGAAFVAALRKAGVKGQELSPGGSLVFDGARPRK